MNCKQLTAGVSLLPLNYRLNVDAWSPLAERCQQHMRKGMRVQVHGTLKYDEWADKSTGSKRTALTLTAQKFWEILPSGALTCMRSALGLLATFSGCSIQQTREQRGSTADLPRAWLGDFFASRWPLT